MRVVLIVVALVVLLALIGWVSFSNEQGRGSINLETEEIREDTGEAMRQGAEFLREAEEEVAPDTGNSADDAAAPTP